MNKIIALVSSFILASAALAATTDNWIRYGSRGTLTYADGTTQIADGEHFALVWSPNATSAGLNSNGTAVGENEEVVLDLALAEDGVCPQTLFQVTPGKTTGSFWIYLRDTRAENAGDAVLVATAEVATEEIVIAKSLIDSEVGEKKIISFNFSQVAGTGYNGGKLSGAQETIAGTIPENAFQDAQIAEGVAKTAPSSATSGGCTISSLKVLNTDGTVTDDTNKKLSFGNTYMGNIWYANGAAPSTIPTTSYLYNALLPKSGQNEKKTDIYYSNSGIDFYRYDVIIYLTGYEVSNNYTADKKFPPVQVNNKWYKGDTTATGETKTVEVTEGTADNSWGTAPLTANKSVLGQNAIRVNNIKGDLHIEFPSLANCRYDLGIAAIQIIENFDIDDRPRNWTGSGSDDNWSTAANWDTGVPNSLTDVAIPVDKQVVVDGTSEFKSLTGAGTIIFDGSLPSEAFQTEFQKATWTGVVWIKNVEAVNFDPALYGNANSTVRVTGVSKWFADEDKTFAGTFDLRDEGETKALTITDGHSNKSYTFAKLTGSGTWNDAITTSATPLVKINDLSEFTGAFVITKEKISLMASETSDISSGQIKIGANSTVTPGANWSASNGYLNNGTLVISQAGTIKLANGSGALTIGANEVTVEVPENTSAAITTLTGTGTLTKTGAGSLRLAGDSSTTFTGSVVVSAGALVLENAAALAGASSVSVGATGEIALASGARSANLSDVTFAEGATLAVVGTVADDGRIVLPGLSSIPANATLAVVMSDYVSRPQNVQATVVDGQVVLTYTPMVSGASCLYDFTFTNTVTTARGSRNAATMNCDATAVYTQNSIGTGVKTACGGWLSLSALSTLQDFTIVVVGTIPSSNNTMLVSFGSTNSKCIFLSSTQNANELAVKHFTNSGAVYANLAELAAPHATTSAHVFSIVKHGSEITIYLDQQAQTTLSAAGYEIGDGGVQLGADFGGAIRTGGTYKTVTSDDTSIINALRIYDGALGPNALAALASEYHYVSPSGSASRTFADGDSWITDAGDTSWSFIKNGQTVTTNAPQNEASVTIVNTDAATVSINLDSAADVTYEQLTVNGSGTMTLVSGEVNTHKIKPSATVINTDTILDVHAFDLTTGPLTVAAGKTVTFDLSSVLESELFVIQRTFTNRVAGVCTLGEGAQIRVTPSTIGIYSLSVAPMTGGYGIVYTPDHEAGSVVYYAGGTWSDNPATTLSVSNAQGKLTHLFSGDIISLKSGDVLQINAAANNYTFAGSGKLQLASNYALRLDSNWTGTVALPQNLNGTGEGGFNFNAYGKSGSTIEVNGLTFWHDVNTETNPHILPKLVLNGELKSTGCSTREYTYAEITGTGNITLNSETAPTSFTITKLSNYTGTLANNMATGVAVSTLVLPATPAAGAKILSKSGNVTVSAVKLADNTPITGFVTRDDGLYMPSGLTVSVASTTFQDYTNATLKVSVTGDSSFTPSTATYAATIGGTQVTGTYVAATETESAYVKFEVPGTSGASANVSISVTGGNSTGGQTSTAFVFGERTNWFSETAAADAFAKSGAWTRASTSDGRIAIDAEEADATFTPTTNMFGKVADVTTVMSFEAPNDDEVVLETGSQAAFRVVTGTSGYKFQIWVNGSWVDVTTPAAATLATQYTIVTHFDYSTGTYSMTINDTPVSTAAGTAFALPTGEGAKTKVSSLAFKGMGALDGVSGQYYDNSVAVDEDGQKYASIGDVPAGKTPTVTNPNTIITVDPAKIPTIPAGMTADKIKPTYKGASLDDVVAVSIEDGKVKLDIKEDKEDEVRPTATAMAMPTAAEGEREVVQFTIDNPKPGLFYSVVESDSPDFDSETATVTDHDGEQAASAEAKTVSATLPTESDKKVKYYKVRVKATK